MQLCCRAMAQPICALLYTCTSQVDDTCITVCFCVVKEAGAKALLHVCTSQVDDTCQACIQDITGKRIWSTNTYLPN
jgi:hypothetical protein